MADEKRVETAPQPTRETALANASRLLANAELETNLATMGQLAGLADSWLTMAGLLSEKS
jgi:hypothetical protein